MSKIQIICSSPGIRRNGIEHPASAIYDADHWNDKQLQAFRDDPAFIVQEVAAGGVKLPKGEIDAAVAAKVAEQVEAIKQDMQAAFDAKVKEATDEKLAEASAAHETIVTDLKTKLEVADAKIKELEVTLKASAKK